MQHRVVSQDEVFPLRAPFAVYEPCITPFLTQDCDPDRDGKITLAEWGECLDIDAGEQSATFDQRSLECFLFSCSFFLSSTDELEDKCADFVKLSSQVE